MYYEIWQELLYIRGKRHVKYKVSDEDQEDLNALRCAALALLNEHQPLAIPPKPIFHPMLRHSHSNSPSTSSCPQPPSTRNALALALETKKNVRFVDLLGEMWDSDDEEHVKNSSYPPFWRGIGKWMLNKRLWNF